MEIAFVTPRGAMSPPPSALELLNHELRHVVGGDDVGKLAPEASLVMVDARTDLVAARTACLVVHGSGTDWPILLLVPASG